jgi:error-prone DNA polymerase
MELDYLHAQSFIEHHPLELYRSMLERRQVTRAADLERCRPGALVEVAGVVIVRQRPGGGKMIFMALEDETGLVDIAVYLSLFERYRPLIMLSSILLVRGELQLDGKARSVLARRFFNLSDGAQLRARNFH